MRLRVSFWSGPLHGTTAMTGILQDNKVFFDEAERLVYVYRRDERDYNYDEDKSARATAVYDKVKYFLEPRDVESVEFDEYPVRDPDQGADVP